MRHQVYPAAHPDALYAIWDGQPYLARTSTSDGTVLLVAGAGAEPPEGFDREFEGAPARVVNADDVTDTFAIHSHFRYADELFMLAGQAEDGRLALQWTGSDEATARKLGLIAADGNPSFGTFAAPEHIEAMWQERHDFTERTEPPPPVDGQKLLRGIGRLLRGMRPDGGGPVAAQFRQVGGYSELEVRTVVEDVTYSLAAPPVLGQLFGELRASMYQPDAGAWFTGTFTLTPDDKFDFTYDSASQPHWRRSPDEDGRPTGRAFAAELARFPRPAGQVPPWLAARAGLPLDVQFRHAKVVDTHNPGQPPLVERPPVPPNEVRGVLNYLYSSPVVHVGSEGPQPDIFAPQTAPSVPPAFHTDGQWIWPAAVPHYLRMHGLAPEPELLERIRENSYRPPFVSQRLRETARAEILGEPYPPQSAADLDEYDAVTEVERDDSVQPVLRASQVLQLLEKRLGELGISPRVYAIGEQSEDAWCLYHVGGDLAAEQPPGWQVALHAGGRRYREQWFEAISNAAAYLLGMLAFHPTRVLAKPDEAEAPTDWPVQPLRGEPPLTLLRGKRMVVLPAGTAVVRFGNDAGNLVHEATATFRETSLLPDRERQRTEYLLARPVRVLTGVALPFGGMPGGALAYLLPGPVGHHLETGALTKLVAPAPEAKHDTNVILAPREAETRATRT